jgi:hypothetical protein
MEELTVSDLVTKRDLADINKCRVYLRVFFLSDIENIQGEGFTACSSYIRAQIQQLVEPSIAIIVQLSHWKKIIMNMPLNKRGKVACGMRQMK